MSCLPPLRSIFTHHLQTTRQVTKREEKPSWRGSVHSGDYGGSSPSKYWLQTDSDTACESPNRRPLVRSSCTRTCCAGASFHTVCSSLPARRPAPPTEGVWRVDVTRGSTRGLVVLVGYGARYSLRRTPFPLDKVLCLD